MSEDGWEPGPLDLMLNGVVVDEAKAKATPCECVETPNNKLMCWSEGIVGVLSQEQIKKYCPKIIKKTHPRLTKRLVTFSLASKLCRPLELKNRFECISIALTKGLDEARKYLEAHKLVPGKIPVEIPTSTKAEEEKTAEQLLEEIPEEEWLKHAKVK